MGVAFPPRKTALATETTRSSHSGTQRQRREGTSRGVSRSSASSQVEVVQDDTQGDVFMTASSESLRDARNQRSPIFNAKFFTRIGTWNVRTLFQCGRLDQVLKEMQKYKLDILGLSEVRWTGQGRFTSGQATILYTVATRRRRFIGHVLRLPMSRPASLLFDWTPEGGRRRRGRPKRTWRDTFAEDMREMGVSGSGTHDEAVQEMDASGSGIHDEARSVASDHARWRQLVAQCSRRDRRT